jgi:hypothetical protein
MSGTFTSFCLIMSKIVKFTEIVYWASNILFFITPSVENLLSFKWILVSYDQDACKTLVGFHVKYPLLLSDFNQN